MRGGGNSRWCVSLGAVRDSLLSRLCASPAQCCETRSQDSQSWWCAGAWSAAGPLGTWKTVSRRHVCVGGEGCADSCPAAHSRWLGEVDKSGSRGATGELEQESGPLGSMFA